MTGSITTIEQLEKWFRAANLPFFSIRYAGQGEKIVFRNEVWEDMEDAWEQLKNQVEAQASAGRAMLEILVFSKGKANHPLRTNVDIRPGYQPATAAPGIAGHPWAGIGNVTDYVNTQVKLAMLERDNEDLRAQIGSPMNAFERVLERVAESPHLAGIAQNLLAGLFKAPMQPMQAVPVTGVPPEAQPTQEGDDYPEQMFVDLESAAGVLGTTPEALAAKVAMLVKQNPELAKTFL